MRRPIGVILVGLGAFLIAMAPLLRFYVAHVLVVVPTDTYQQVTLRATNAEYFSFRTLSPVTGANLTATVTTRGDVNKSTSKIAVFDMFEDLYDPTSSYDIGWSKATLPVDRHSGKILSCCGASVQPAPSSVKFDGYQVKFPFNSQKTTYPYFDSTLGRSYPIQYAGTDKVDGVTAYKYYQHIPPTEFTTMSDVPGSILGLGSQTGNLTVGRYYEDYRTVWIEPTTGAPLKQEEHQIQTLRTSDGVQRLKAVDFDVKMDSASSHGLKNLATKNKTLIELVEVWAPLSFLILGIVAVGAGLYTSEVFTGRPGQRRAIV